MPTSPPQQMAAHALPVPRLARHALPWTLAATALLAGCQTSPSVYTTPALSAQPHQIQAGQSARLSWDAPLGSSLHMSGLTATPPGSVLVRPAQTTTYTLSGPAPSGADISASVTVEVQPASEPLARLRIGDQPTGARIASGFLGLVHDAGQTPQRMGSVHASYRQLLRNLQNYGDGPLTVRMDSGTAAQARKLFANLPPNTVTLDTTRGANDCPAVEPLAHAYAPAAPRCTAGPGAESALATADLLLHYAQRGLSGVNLPGGIWNTPGQPAAVAPRYYGMLFFAQFAGAQSQWLPTQLESSARIQAWAVRDTRNQTVRVAVINQEPGTSGTVAVQLPAGLRQAVVTRLTTSDPLRLAGQTFDGSRDGQPMGTAYGEILDADSDGQLLLAVGAASAALLTLTPSAP